MAKVGMIQRDVKRKELNKQFANKRARLKAIIMNKETPADERFAAVMALNELPTNSAKNRQRNRCALTGRPRGFFRQFKLCRNQLREKAQLGELPGVTKSSW